MKQLLWAVALGWGGVACGGSAMEGSPAQGNVAGIGGTPAGGVSGGGAGGVSGASAKPTDPSAGDTATGSADGSQPAAAAWDHSWNAVLHIADKSSKAGAECDGMSFTLDFPTHDGAQLAVASRNGEAYDLKLQAQPDGSLLESSSTALLSLSSACPGISFEFSAMSLHVANGALTGTAKAVAEYQLLTDNALAPDNIDVSFTGLPDTTAPTLQLPGVLNPTDHLFIGASEALASAAVMLTGSGAPLPLTASVLDASTPVLISLSTDVVLPFSGSWQLSGAGQDFAGNQLLLGQTISTVADPGVFAQDGFEGTLHALQPDKLSQITDASFVVKPIAGDHSLLVKVGGAVTLHLLRSAGQSMLAFNVIDLIPPGTAPGATSPQFAGYAAVIGGTQRASLTWAVTGKNAISNDTWIAASNTALVKVPLTEPGSDVAIAFTAPETNFGPYGVDGPHYQSDSLLIDDVHLE